MKKQERERIKLIETNLKLMLKKISKEYKWSYKNFIIFKKLDGLFFEAMVSYIHTRKVVEIKIAYKPIALDDLFWDIFNLPENKNQPLSFRCFGAFTVRAFEIKKWYLEVENEELEFNSICHQIVDESQKVIDDISSRVLDLNTYILHLKELFLQHQERYPGSVVDINLELILTNILQGNIKEALSLINERLTNKDKGRFMDSCGGIYDYAKEYCEKVVK